MNVPNHIAIILDGNGRWAKERGMPRTYGHVKGCANLENICYDIKDLGVKYLTVYAFSTENWKRSREEVEALMKLFRSYLKKCIKISKKNNMRMKVIGDITAFAPDIQQSVRELEEYSKDFDGIYFQLALNYGSRDEIRRGMQNMAQDVKDGKVERNAGVRVIREDVVIHEGKLASLKRFKDDVKEVAKGFECGLQIENYNDIKEGDIIEVFVMEEIKRTKKSKVQQISQEHVMNNK